MNNDYPDEIENETSERNQLQEEKTMDLKQKKKSVSNLASKRPVQREKETLDIEPLNENNLVIDNKKSETIEIDDPW